MGLYRIMTDNNPHNNIKIIDSDKIFFINDNRDIKIRNC